MPTVTALAAYSVSDPFANFWHLRYCHLGDPNIRNAMKVVHGMTMPTGCLCIDCVETRLKQRPHKGHFKRGEYNMEFLHVNIKSVPEEGHDNSRYAIVILCDKSQRVWAKGAAHKSELGNYVLTTLAAHETLERRCRRIRIDQAGENRSSHFIQTRTNRGIIFEPTGTDQHQQNGSAEVTIRIIQERLAPTMRSSKLEMKWWPEILQTIVKTKNVSPSAVLGGITPTKSGTNTNQMFQTFEPPAQQDLSFAKKTALQTRAKENSLTSRSSHAV
jgi:hypothetical protein